MSKRSDVLGVRLPLAEADAYRDHARRLGVPVSVAIRRALDREMSARRDGLQAL
jgi:hypothetical protein